MDNADLAHLAVSPGKIRPVFKASVREVRTRCLLYVEYLVCAFTDQPLTLTLPPQYSVTVSSACEAVAVDGYPDDGGASMRVVGDCKGDRIVPVKEGGNVVTVEVSSEDGSATTIYTIQVKRLSPTDATLSSLRVCTGKTNHPLIPAFSSATTR